MTFCGERTLLGEAGGHGVAASARCRCYSCPECEALEKAKLDRLIRQLNPTHFVTLTVSPHHFATPDEQARWLSRAFSLMRRRLRRRFGAKFDFVAVFEAHESGWAHLHIVIADCPISPADLQRLLTEWMAELMGRSNVDVRPVTNLPGLASYLSEEPHKFAGCRRFWTSRGWRVAPWASDAIFRLVTIARAPLREVERRALAIGHVIFERSRLRFKTLLPFNPP